MTHSSLFSLFAISILCGVVGLFPWIYFGFFSQNFYPGLFHREVMFLGFGSSLVPLIWFYESGIPSWAHRLLLLIFLAILGALGFRITWLLSLGVISLIGFVLALRLRARDQKIDSLFFVDVALVGYWMVCAYCFVEGVWQSWTAIPPQIGTLCQTFFWAILLRSSPIVREAMGRSRKNYHWPEALAMGFLIISSLAELWGIGPYSLWLRCLGGLLLLVFGWDLLRLPDVKNGMTLSCWFGAWLIALGGLTVGLFPNYTVHLVHFVLVGGASLALYALVLMKLGLGHRKKLGWWFLVNIGLACVTRATAFFLDGSFIRHLGYAALLWILMMSYIWFTGTPLRKAFGAHF